MTATKAAGANALLSCDLLGPVRRPDGSLPLFLRTSQAAALMDVDIRTIRAGIADGTIQAIHLGAAIRIPLAPFLALCGLPAAEVSRT